MADISNIRYGLDYRLSQVDGLNAHSHSIPSSVAATPMAFVSIPLRAGGNIHRFDQTMQSGFTRVSLSVVLLVSKIDDGIAQDAIDPFLGDDSTNASSIYRAIMADQSLTFPDPRNNNVSNGPNASSLWVSAAHSYGKHPVAGVEYLGCLFDIEILPLKK